MTVYAFIAECNEEYRRRKDCDRKDGTDNQSARREEERQTNVRPKENASEVSWFYAYNTPSERMKSEQKLTWVPILMMSMCP